MSAIYKQYQKIDFTDTIVFILSILFEELIIASKKDGNGIFTYKNTIATELNFTLENVISDIKKVYGKAIVYSEIDLNGVGFSTDELWLKYNTVIDDFKKEYPNLTGGCYFYFPRNNKLVEKNCIIEFLERITNAKLF